jgi:hypothetical protein
MDERSQEHLILEEDLRHVTAETQAVRDEYRENARNGRFCFNLIVILFFLAFTAFVIGNAA